MTQLERMAGLQSHDKFREGADGETHPIDSKLLTPRCHQQNRHWTLTGCCTDISSNFRSPLVVSHQQKGPQLIVTTIHCFTISTASVDFANRRRNGSIIRSSDKSRRGCTTSQPISQSPALHSRRVQPAPSEISPERVNSIRFSLRLSRKNSKRTQSVRKPNANCLHPCLMSTSCMKSSIWPTSSSLSENSRHAFDLTNNYNRFFTSTFEANSQVYETLQKACFVRHSHGDDHRGESPFARRSQSVLDSSKHSFFRLLAHPH